jgi:hypothetical protein
MFWRSLCTHPIALKDQPGHTGISGQDMINIGYKRRGETHFTNVSTRFAMYPTMHHW